MMLPVESEGGSVLLIAEEPAVLQGGCSRVVRACQRLRVRQMWACLLLILLRWCGGLRSVWTVGSALRRPGCRIALRCGYLKP